MVKRSKPVTYKNNLRICMLKAGMKNMQQLADATGVSKAMLHLFERGESSLSIENLCKVLKALGCNFEELIEYRE